MLKEFRDFALRGNVVDLAVGFIIGGAFSTIVTSLVNDIIMPPIGLVLGGVDFSDIALTLKAAEGETAAVTMNIGLFINSVISFTIVAFALFMIVKAMNSLKKAEAAALAAPPAQEVLLAEIRDLLKTGR